MKRPSLSNLSAVDREPGRFSWSKTARLRQAYWWNCPNRRAASERNPQGELYFSWVIQRAVYGAEPRRAHLTGGRAKLGPVERIEKLGFEDCTNMLGDLSVFRNRNIPVLNPITAQL